MSLTNLYEYFVNLTKGTALCQLIQGKSHCPQEDLLLSKHAQEQCAGRQACASILMNEGWKRFFSSSPAAADNPGMQTRNLW